MGQKPLQHTGLSNSRRMAHQQAKVEPGYVNDQTLENVFMAAQVSPTHATCLVAMREAPFNAFSSKPHQPLASLPSNPATISICGLLLRFLFLPVAATPLRLR